MSPVSSSFKSSESGTGVIDPISCHVTFTSLKTGRWSHFSEASWVAHLQLPPGTPPSSRLETWHRTEGTCLAYARPCFNPLLKEWFVWLRQSMDNSQDRKSQWVQRGHYYLRNSLNPSTKGVATFLTLGVRKCIQNLVIRSLGDGRVVVYVSRRHGPYVLFPFRAQI